MLFEITHRTRYHYSEPVFLEPMTVRQRPCSNAWQTLYSYDLRVTPSPAGISHCIGLDGNNTATIWFDGLHDELLIEAHSNIETHHGNPFNYLVTDPDALKLPLKYDPHLGCVLTHYLSRDTDDAKVRAFAREIMQAAKHETIPFLALLVEQIHIRIEYLFREHGEPWVPGMTLQKAQGSCRDMAVLFIDICRSAALRPALSADIAQAKKPTPATCMHGPKFTFLGQAGAGLTRVED